MNPSGLGCAASHSKLPGAFPPQFTSVPCGPHEHVALPKITATSRLDLPRSRLRFIFRAVSSTVSGGWIVEIDVLVDPERLRRLDLADFDD